MAQFVGLQLVQVVQRIQRLPAEVAIHAWRIAHIEHGIPFAAALHALEDRRNEARPPAALAATRLHATTDEDDESWQVIIFRTQSIGDPGAHARATLAGRSGKQ